MVRTEESEVDKSKLRENSGRFEWPTEKYSFKIQKSNKVRMP